MNPVEEFLERFVRDVPGFDELYEIHVEEYGEHDGPLGHVFFGLEVVPATVDSYLGRDNEESDWRLTLAYLEEQYGHGIREVNAVIVTSFLEMLPYPWHDGYGISRHLGPKLKAKLAELRPASMIPG